MKDPAILWYFNDWGGGTRTMSRYLKGCYIDILEAEFNSGPLSLEEIRTVLGQDQAAWTVLSKKFKQDSNGLFYNERLEAEKAKRAAYCDSRRKNRQKNEEKGKEEDVSEHMKNICETYDQHMENRNRNINEIEKGVQGEKQKKFIPPTLEEVTAYCAERNNHVDPKKWIDFYTAKGWMIGKNKMKDWKAAVRTWEEDKPKQETSSRPAGLGSILTISRQ